MIYFFFSILRVQSLTDLGYDDPVRINNFLESLGILGDLLRNLGFSDFMSMGVLLLNLQMIGMMIGGIFWGIL